MSALSLTHSPALFPWEQRRVGSYYGPWGAHAAFNGIGLAANVLHAVPFWTGLRGTYDRLGIVITVGAGASSIRLGVYDTNWGNPADPLPGNLVVDSGVLSGVAAVLVQSVVALALAPRSLYWLVYTCDNAAITVRASSSVPWFGYDPAGETFFTIWSVARAFAALPAVFPGGGAPSILTIQTPFIALRAS